MSTTNRAPLETDEDYSEVPAFNFGASNPTEAALSEEDLEAVSFNFGPSSEEDQLLNTSSFKQGTRLRLQDIGKKPQGDTLDQFIAAGGMSPEETSTKDDIDPKSRTMDAQDAELPYFGSRLDIPEIQEQKTLHGDQPQGVAQMGLYLAQEAGKGVAGGLDLATAVIDAAPVLGWAKHEAGKFFGAIPKGKPYTVGFGATTEMYKEDILPKTYEALGYDTDEITPTGAMQRAYGLAAENVGAGGIFKLAQVGVRGAKGLGTMLWDDYTKSELLASGSGAAAGGVGYALYDTPEGKEQAAYLGNFAGAFFPVLKYAAGTYWLKRTADNYRGSAGEIDDLSDRLVNQDIAKLVPIEDIPEIKRRIKIFRGLQEKAPDFKPTWSSLIQTPRVKQVQAWTDTKFADKAEVIYKRNNDIVKSLANKFGLDPKGENFEAITIAADMVAAQGAETSRAYLKQISDLQEQIATVGRTASTTDPLTQGLQYRQQLQVLEKKFDEHVKYMYSQVDPDNVIKVPLNAITESFTAAREATKKASATKAINYGTDPLANRLEDLDAIAERLNPAAYKGASNPQAKFNQLIEQRKELDRIARAAVGVPGGSQVYVLARNMAEGLNQVLDDTLEALGPDTYGAYVAARASYKDLYLPAFNSEKNIITRHLSTTVPKGQEFRVDVDKLLKEVWVEGKAPTELSAVQLNTMLKEASGIVNEKFLGPAKQIIDLKVQEHALASLNRVIGESENPAKSVKSWLTQNEVNLKNFPHVQQKVDDIVQEVQYRDMGVSDLRVKEAALQKEIISKYTKLDVETFLEGIPKLSAKQARDTMKEIFYGAGVKNADLGIPSATKEMMEKGLVLNKSIPAFMKKLKKLDPESHAKIFELQKSVSGEILAEIVRKGIRNDGNPGLSSNFFNQIMNGNHPGYKIDTVKEVLTPEDYKFLKNFTQLANATQDTFAPAGKINLQYLQQLEQELGISFSSVSSRIYAQQLGKVGPVFVFTDTGLKLLKARHGTKLDKQLGDVMYDMDALEVAMEQRLRMASGQEKEIIADQMTKAKAFKTDLKIKSKFFVSDSGKFLIDKFIDVMIKPDNLPTANKLKAYLMERSKEPEASTGIERVYQALTGDGMFMRGGPSEEDWEEFDRRKKDFKFDIEDGENPLDLKDTETEDTSIMEDDNSTGDVVEDLYNNLVNEEGAEGDTTGAAVTGKLGVTEGARRSIKGSENMSDPEIAKAYVAKLNNLIPEEVPYEVRYALIDSAYNIGEGMFKYKGIRTSMQKGDWMGVAENLLDTASIGGEASKGIAARRARAYNKIAAANGKDVIENVFQAEDGTISYLGKGDKTVFSYRPKGGRHDSSAVGILDVHPSETMASSGKSTGA